MRNNCAMLGTFHARTQEPQGKVVERTTVKPHNLIHRETDHNIIISPIALTSVNAIDWAIAMCHVRSHEPICVALDLTSQSKSYTNGLSTKI